MTEYKYSARAVAKVELEIHCSSTWGTGTTMDQVHQQACEDALGAIRHMIEKSGHRASIKAIGEPTIRCILTDQKRS